MGNYGGGPVKMVGKQRGAEGTQQEVAQRRSGMSHQLSKVHKHILNGAVVSRQKRFRGKRGDVD